MIPEPTCIVSHRGNLVGADPKVENTTAQIERVADLRIPIEIDVREKGGKLFLGHDEPQEELTLAFLNKLVKGVSQRLYKNQAFLGTSVLYQHLILHAKTVQTVEHLMERSPKVMPFFYHESDKIVKILYTEGATLAILNSRGKSLDWWCYPGTYMKRGITVQLGEREQVPLCGGICTDYPLHWLGVKTLDFTHGRES